MSLNSVKKNVIHREGRRSVHWIRWQKRKFTEFSDEFFTYMNQTAPRWLCSPPRGSEWPRWPAAPCCGPAPAASPWQGPPTSWAGPREGARRCSSRWTSRRQTCARGRELPRTSSDLDHLSEGFRIFKISKSFSPRDLFSCRAAASAAPPPDDFRL